MQRQRAHSPSGVCLGTPGLQLERGHLHFRLRLLERHGRLEPRDNAEIPRSWILVPGIGLRNPAIGRAPTGYFGKSEVARHHAGDSGLKAVELDDAAD